MDAWTKTLKKVNFKEDFITYPCYIISRPFKGFSDLKYENRGKKYFAVIMMVLMCIFSICNDKYRGVVLTGYYTENKTDNALYIIFMTLAPVLLFVVGNWCITAITDGAGKMKEIFMVYAYAVYPQLFLQIIGLIVSNFITVDEVAFAKFFYAFGSFAFLFYLFIGLIIIHEYSFTKALGMIVLTIAAMCIIIFIFALAISLSGEVISFIKTVCKEISLRL